MQNKFFEMMTLNDYHIIINVKIHEIWNLHRVSQEFQKQSLDFFIMLSSISDVIDNKSQINCTAVNTFLDAFVSYWKTLDLRVNIVDLKLIKDVDYVAEQDFDLDTRFDKWQWTSINESVLCKILTYSILQQNISASINVNSSIEMITDIDFSLSKNDSDLTRKSRFSYLFNDHEDSKIDDMNDDVSSDQSDQAIKQFHMMQKFEIDATSLCNASVKIVSKQFVKILRLETKSKSSRSLMMYELDSLSAVELRNWIRVKLEIELTTLDITNADSLITLCEKMISKLSQSESVKKKIDWEYSDLIENSTTTAHRLYLDYLYI